MKKVIAKGDKATADEVKNARECYDAMDSADKTAKINNDICQLELTVAVAAFKAGFDWKEGTDLTALATPAKYDGTSVSLTNCSVKEVKAGSDTACVFTIDTGASSVTYAADANKNQSFTVTIQATSNTNLTKTITYTLVKKDANSTSVDKLEVK